MQQVLQDLPLTLAYIGADLVALAFLVGALYIPRHGRRDLVAAYIGVNVGVLAVTLLLSTSATSEPVWAWDSSVFCPSSACAPPPWPGGGGLLLRSPGPGPARRHQEPPHHRRHPHGPHPRLAVGG